MSAPGPVTWTEEATGRVVSLAILMLDSLGGVLSEEAAADQARDRARLTWLAYEQTNPHGGGVHFGAEPAMDGLDTLRRMAARVAAACEPASDLARVAAELEGLLACCARRIQLVQLVRILNA